MNEFLKYLRKGIVNTRGKKPIDKCEKILGTNTAVNAFGMFASEQEENIMIVVAAILQKWEAEKEFTKDELAIYRLGLTEFPIFLLECKAEQERKHQEKLDQLKANAESGAIPVQR